MVGRVGFEPTKVTPFGGERYLVLGLFLKIFQASVRGLYLG